MEKIYIHDLNLSETDKKILFVCIKPKSTAEVAAKCSIAYSTANQKIMILKELSYIKKFENMSKRKLFKTNEDIISLEINKSDEVNNEI